MTTAKEIEAAQRLRATCLQRLQNAGRGDLEYSIALDDLEFANQNLARAKRDEAEEKSPAPV